MRETIFSELRHTPGRSLAFTVGERLAPYLTEGRAYTHVREERDGMLYAVLIDTEARIAVQVWDAVGETTQDAPEAPTEAAEGLPWALPDLTIGKDSETPQVVEWCRLAGLRASVVGAWVWVPDSSDNRRLAGGPEALERELRARGFYFSKRRQQFFHDCTVPAAKDRKPGGKLERFHGASSLDTYAAGKHDARPGWRQAQDAKRAAATAKKARRA